MFELTRQYVVETLKEEKLWKVGESDSFSFEGWEITLRKEETYKPFIYSIKGKNGNGSYMNRRYVSMEEAFLHIVNHFNENANIKDKYKSIEEFITSK